MKIKVTESQLTSYFKEVITETDMCSCDENLLSEGLTANDKNEIKSLVKKEIKDFLDMTRSSDLERKVGDIIKNKLKNDKDIEKYLVDLTKNVLIQMYKNLYTRKSFWVSDLKNSSS